MIELITGGTRSGKSTYAQDLALQLDENPIYIATSRIHDDEFKERVDRHKNDRNIRFGSVEKDLFITEVDINKKVVVIDCVTLWLLNVFTDMNENIDKSLDFINSEIDKLLEKDAHILMITNEIGMGVIGETYFTRKFVDLQGWTNQYIAEKSNSVTLMVSGIPLKVK